MNRYVIDVAHLEHSLFEVWADSGADALDKLFSGDDKQYREINGGYYAGEEEVEEINCYTREEGYGLGDNDESITWINGEWKTKKEVMA